jgi:hypothetical protein
MVPEERLAFLRHCGLWRWGGSGRRNDGRASLGRLWVARLGATVRSVNGFNTAYLVDDEAITLPGNGLDKPRPFGIIPKGSPDFENGGVDAVLGVDKDALAPETFANLLAGDDVPVAFDQKDEQIHRDPLEPYRPSVPTQLETAAVQLIVAKFVGGRRHDKP